MRSSDDTTQLKDQEDVAKGSKKKETDGHSATTAQMSPREFEYYSVWAFVRRIGVYLIPLSYLFVIGITEHNLFSIIAGLCPLIMETIWRFVNCKKDRIIKNNIKETIASLRAIDNEESRLLVELFSTIRSYYFRQHL